MENETKQTGFPKLLELNVEFSEMNEKSSGDLSFYFLFVFSEIIFSCFFFSLLNHSLYVFYEEETKAFFSF